MKIEIDETDIVRGAEFVAHGERLIVVCETGNSDSFRLVNLHTSRLTGHIGAKDIVFGLNRYGALPAWLSRAQTVQKAAAASAAD